MNNRIYSEDNNESQKGFVLDDMIRQYEERIQNFDVGFQIAVIQERFRINAEYKKRLKIFLKKLKEELQAEGIPIRPGSDLRRLLNTNHLPEDNGDYL